MARRDRLVRLALRSRFLITTVDNEAFEGVLIDSDESNFVLADAAAVAANGVRSPVDGHLWIPRPVRYMQESAPHSLGWSSS